MSTEITHLKPREDAEYDPRTHCMYVPSKEYTRWIHNWEEFLAANGRILFNGDQTEVYLCLPEGCKFSIKFMDK